MADRHIVLPYLHGLAVYRCDERGGARLTDALPQSTAYRRRADMIARAARPAAGQPPAAPARHPVIAQAAADPAPERPGRRHVAKPKPAATRDRPCMTCGTVFRSEGAHNRLCNFCRRQRDDVQASPYGICTASGLRRRG